MSAPTPRRVAIWAALVLAFALPMGLAATSPYLAYRDVVYIASGFAAVLALYLTFLQPVLATAGLPGLHIRTARRIHRLSGLVLLGAVLVHVAGLWITSPPDVIDALTFTSPTAFSAWGVVAMWAVFATATLAALRRPLRLSPRVWRLGHTALAVVIAVGGVVHAVLIEGTMETISKVVLCALVVLATGRVVLDFWGWRRRG